MSTAITSETETVAAAAATIAAPVAAPAAAPAAAAVSAVAVDVSAIPETPAELLKQWPAAAPAPRRPLLHTVISATLVRFWDALTGPGMTQQERVDRAIAEHNGFIRNLGRKV